MKLLVPDPSHQDISAEIETLRNEYSSIAKQVGRYVLIQGTAVVDFFDSYGDAINEGYKRFKLGNFLVRLVKAHEKPMRAMRFGLSRKGPMKPTIRKSVKA